MARITKKYRLARVRDIIDSNQLNIPFSAEDTVEMCNLLETRSAGFVKKDDPKYHTDKRHLHFLVDGVWGAKSWRKCITPLKPLTVVKLALRGEVEGILKDFRNEVTSLACADCGSIKQPTTDHVDPPFDEIADTYIAHFGLPKLEVTPEGIGYELMYQEDLESWLTHHAKHAVYQILCRSCNASKGKRKPKKRKSAENNLNHLHKNHLRGNK